VEAVEAQNRRPGGSKWVGLLARVANFHHFDEEQDPDPH